MYVIGILIDAPSMWLTHEPLVTVMSLLDYLPDSHPPKVVTPCLLPLPPSPSSEITFSITHTAGKEGSGDSQLVYIAILPHGLYCPVRLQV